MARPKETRGTINAITGGGGGAGGRSAFGSVPGPISVPPNIYSQVSGVLPNFANLTSGTSDVVGSELSGQVSPATMKALQNAAATFGVQSGTGFGPGTLAGNAYMGNVAGYSENRQRQGLQDYLSTLTGLGHTMTDPGLAAEIASRNATFAAAPDPRLAAEEQDRRWLEKFKLTQGLGGPSGGTGAWGAGGRPPDAPSFGGGYSRGKDALGFDLPSMTSWWSDRAVNPPALGAGGNSWDNATWNPASPNYNPWFSNYSPSGGGGSDFGSLQEEFFPETTSDFWSGY